MHLQNLIEWNNDQFLLDFEIMDDTHKEFISLVNQLHLADGRYFPALFNNLIAHTKLHFQLEENLMCQSDFPAYAEHKSEHQRILGELNQLKKRVDKGSVTFARGYIKDRIPEWFELHAASMDSALVSHLKSAL